MRSEYVDAVLVVPTEVKTVGAPSSYAFSEMNSSWIVSWVVSRAPRNGRSVGKEVCDDDEDDKEVTDGVDPLFLAFLPFIVGLSYVLLESGIRDKAFLLSLVKMGPECILRGKHGRWKVVGRDAKGLGEVKVKGFKSRLTHEAKDEGKRPYYRYAYS